MPKVAPWHSTRPGETVHHDNTRCTEGNNIESYYRAVTERSNAATEERLKSGHVVGGVSIV